MCVEIWGLPPGSDLGGGGSQKLLQRLPPPWGRHKRGPQHGTITSALTCPLGSQINSLKGNVCPVYPTATLFIALSLSHEADPGPNTLLP